MTHAESEISPQRSLKRHLYQHHMRFDTTKYPGLTMPQLSDVHEMFHDDDWLSRPHTHEDGEIKFPEDEWDDYVGMIVEQATEDPDEVD